MDDPSRSSIRSTSWKKILAEFLVEPNPQIRVLFLVGPTACGKSALALRWAQELGAEIINCDSLQTYRGLDIGSAKPPASERALLPHHLFDYIPEGEVQTAGSYSRDFFDLLASRARGKFIVVGGTGFYFQAIEKGMFAAGRAHPELVETLQRELADKGEGVLWEELRAADPIAAARIFPKDHYRLVRALEMIRGFHQTPTQMREELSAQNRPFPFALRKIGIWAERPELELRVAKRTREMLRAGFVEEVRGLIARGWGDWAPLKSVGYRECVAALEGSGSLEDLETQITAATLRLSKKQRTWFKRDPDIQWRPVEETPTSPPTELVHFFQQNS